MVYRELESSSQSLSWFFFPLKQFHIQQLAYFLPDSLWTIYPGRATVRKTQNLGFLVGSNLGDQKVWWQTIETGEMTKLAHFENIGYLTGGR